MKKLLLLNLILFSGPILFAQESLSQTVIMSYVDGPVSVSFSHDGAFLAVAAPEGDEPVIPQVPGKISTALRPAATTAEIEVYAVWLWDVEKGEFITPQPLGHTADVTEELFAPNVSFSPNSLLLAFASLDKTVQLWDVETRSDLATLEGHTGEISRLAFSPDGKILVSGTVNGVIKVWDVESHKEVATLKGHTQAIYSAAFSHDGTALATGAWNGIVRVWDMENHSEIATFGGYDSSVLQGLLEVWFTPVSFQPGGMLLAYGAFDRLMLWDAKARRDVATHENLTGIYAIDFSPDGRVIVSSSFLGTKLWDTTTHRNIATLVEYQLEDDVLFAPVVFSPIGTILASTEFSDEERTDTNVVIWDVETTTKIASLPHPAGVWSLTFSPDGTQLVSFDFDGFVRLWDLATHISARSPDADFDGDGTVGFGDFLQFAAQFGLSQGDAGYDAKFDLDGNGAIDFGDFVIFAGAFGTS